MPGRARVSNSIRHGQPAPPLLPDCALFLDIDGTLAEFTDEPHQVRIEDEIVAFLPRLAKRLGGALALITGRAIADVDRLLPQSKLPIAGQHGCERRDARGMIHQHAPSPATLARLRAVAADLAARHVGVVFEDKGIAIGLHYRRSPHLGGYLHRALRASLAQDAGHYVLQPGKMLVEVRPGGRDKGTAISDFMAEPPFAGRRPVFVGDDRTDEHGFAVVEELGGWSVKVGPGRTAARFRLADVAAVRKWLLAVPAHSASTTSKQPAREPTISR
jgi:trehalose 6-phosphate phosphatase